MPKCDICGEEFDTERGLHIHQSQKHEEEAEDVETEEEVEDSASDSDSGDEAEEDVSHDDEVVREIEEETAGGLLGSFSRESLVVGGALLGIALGLALGLFLSQGGSSFDKVGPAEVQSKMESLPGAQLNVTSVSEENGVYAVNASSRSITGQTVERTIAHVSLDGEMVFLQGVQYDALKDRLEQSTSNQTTTPDSNQTATSNSTAP